MNVDYTLATFAMSIAGLLLHFLFSWGEFWRAKDTARIGPLPYLALDPPAWLASTLGMIVAYFVLPELGEALGVGGVKVSPLWSLAAGYVGSSMAPKLLGILVARAGVR